MSYIPKNHPFKKHPDWGVDGNKLLLQKVPKERMTSGLSESWIHLASARRLLLSWTAAQTAARWGLLVLHREKWRSSRAAGVGWAARGSLYWFTIGSRSPREPQDRNALNGGFLLHKNCSQKAADTDLGGPGNRTLRFHTLAGSAGKQLWASEDEHMRFAKSSVTSSSVASGSVPRCAFGECFLRSERGRGYDFWETKVFKKIGFWKPYSISNHRLDPKPAAILTR